MVEDHSDREESPGWGAAGTGAQRRETADLKEGNVLFNDAFNTCYLWLYGIRPLR